MPVQNLECQISTVLMKRFLDGDNLPQELLDDLEKHLKVCPSCREIVNNEKVSLEEILDGPQNPKRGVASWMGKISGQPATASGFVTSHPGEALMHAAQTSVHTPAPGLAAFKNPKVLMLSLALAGVLIAMSTIMRDPTAVLGPKAKPVPSATDTEKEKAEDEGSSKDEKGAPGEESGTKDSHGEEAAGHGDEAAHGEGTADAHGEKPAADGHGEESHGNESQAESHSEGAPTEPKGETKVDPKTGIPMTEDPRVPGKPTVDQSDLIIVGGEQKAKPAPKTETKPAPKAESGHGESHTTQKPAAAPVKKPASPPKTTASRPTTRRSTSSTKRRTGNAAKPASKPASKPAAKPSSKPSGVRVYDSEGKPIN